MTKETLAEANRCVEEADLLRKAALRIEGDSKVDRTTITLPSSQAARLTSILRKFATELDEKLDALK